MRWKIKTKALQDKNHLNDVRTIKKFIWFPAFSVQSNEYVLLETAVVKQKYQFMPYHDEKNNFLDWVDIEILPRGAISDSELENNYFLNLFWK